MPQARAVFIMGATASGKSDWALQMAEEFSSVIINCDSIQTYQKLQIGSAQPSTEDKKRVPHYLFSYVKPPEVITAGEYRRHHLEVLTEIQAPAFVVGGTGFYFQALEKGMYPAPAASKEIQGKLEEILKLEGGEDILWEELRQRDPLSAQKIHKKDHYRLVRALELMRRQKRALSDIKNEFAENIEKYPREYIKIGLSWEKEDLLQRVRQRTKKCLKSV